MAVAEQMPNLSGDSGAVGRGVVACGKRGQIRQWFSALADRLRHVRVCCGDWQRVVGASPTFKIGLTAVFLDPPYDMRVVSQSGTGRDGAAPSDALYSHHSNDVSAEVREWAIANGDNRLLRIALCGYDGEHAMPESWECVAWKAAGGYGSQASGRGRDRLPVIRSRLPLSMRHTPTIPASRVRHRSHTARYGAAGCHRWQSPTREPQPTRHWSDGCKVHPTGPHHLFPSPIGSLRACRRADPEKRPSSRF